VKIYNKSLQQKQLEHTKLAREMGTAAVLPGEKYMGCNREQRDIQRKLRELEPEINRLRQLDLPNCWTCPSPLSDDSAFSNVDRVT
jgi:hypothetical protein